jgi:hypothetical protein
MVIASNGLQPAHLSVPGFLKLVLLMVLADCC